MEIASHCDFPPEIFALIFLLVFFIALIVDRKW